jgi:anaerobic magnesium-protoporphyrin IX monomethyl ester cyclase
MTESSPYGYRCLAPGTGSSSETKVLLVYPNTGSQARNVSLTAPLPLLYLASHLKDYAVAIFDQRIDPPEKLEYLLAQSPTCAGFSIMTGVQISAALELAETTKRSGIPTVFGGVHATLLPHQTQEDSRVDHVVAGEGEISFRKLVAALAAGENSPPVVFGEEPDLNAGEDVPWELVDAENYIRNIQIEGRSLPFLFSRGCPFACTFCCNPVISKRRWRSGHIERAVEQLNRLVDRFRLDAVMFFDENLAAIPRVFQELASNIGGRFRWFAQVRANSLLRHDLPRLRQMGAGRFSCGLESGSPRVLDRIKKQETVEEYVEANRRLADSGISVWYNYIVGFPFESTDDVRSTVDLALQMLDENPHADNNTFYVFTPYPGSELGEEYLRSYMPTSLAPWADFGRHNFAGSWHAPEKLKLYERICFSSKFVGRKLSRAYPGESALAEISLIFTEKWRHFDFFQDDEWDRLTSEGWTVLRSIFGEHAY